MDITINTIFRRATLLTRLYGLPVCLIMILAGIITTLIARYGLSEGALDAFTLMAQGQYEQAMSLLEAFSTNIFCCMTVIYAIRLFFNALTTSMACRLCREGGKFQAAHLQLPALKFLKFTAVTLLYSIAVAFGFLLLILPGLYLLLRLFFAPFYVVSRDDAGIAEALRWSWERTQNVQLELLALALVTVGILVGTYIVLALPAAVLPSWAAQMLGDLVTIGVSVFILFVQTATFVTLADSAAPHCGPDSAASAQ